MFSKILNNPLLSLAARLIVGIVFLFFAIGKITDPENFAKSIANYGIMPDFTINLMALTLPWVELICGVFLIAGIRLKSSSLISGGLLIIFIAAVIVAMVKGLNIDCGCSTEAAIKIGWPKILENTGLLIASIYLFFFPVRKLTFEQLAMKEIE
jgi:putative oxidoreductase